MKAWNVYDNYNSLKEVDTVFFDDNCDAQYVYNSLVNHDGMNVAYVELDSNTDIVYPIA